MITPKPITPELIARIDLRKFWSNIAVSDDCWEWRGTKTRLGYGQHGKHFLGVHRLMYCLMIGTAGTNHVLHRCDNRSCVNPKHLFLGDHFSNMADKVSKGRCNSLKGVNHKMAKLTDEEVSQIRALWSCGGYTQQQLGDLFGVGQVNVGCIVRGESWRHLL